MKKLYGNYFILDLLKLYIHYKKTFNYVIYFKKTYINKLKKKMYYF